MSNAYRTVHIGSVTDVEDLGDGLYAVTTVEGNMSNSVKSYCYVYDSNKPNHMVGVEEGLKLQNNVRAAGTDASLRPAAQYRLHTDHWSVFGFARPRNNPISSHAKCIIINAMTGNKNMKEVCHS